jgi:methylated-DNA-[protein]-cysteine S-methyltransferase
MPEKRRTPETRHRDAAAGASLAAASWAAIDLPFARALAVARDGALTSLSLLAPGADPRAWAAGLGLPAEDGGSAEPLLSLRRQLDEYAARRRRSFDIPLAPQGTAFQHEVWGALQRIPYGETVSYEQLAARVGRAGASRAVGQANGRNPIAILVPCHRVVGSDGRLTGYAAGVEIKRALLELEGALAARLFGPSEFR